LRAPRRVTFTTGEALTEYLNGFAAWGPRFRRAAAAASELRRKPRNLSSPTCPSINCAPIKGYSLTDCLSMETMRKEGLIEALTNDRHFEQEGFRALLPDL